MLEGRVLPVAGESCRIPRSQQRADPLGTLQLAVGCGEDGAKEETEAGVTVGKVKGVDCQEAPQGNRDGTEPKPSVRRRQETSGAGGLFACAEPGRLLRS